LQRPAASGARAAHQLLARGTSGHADGLPEHCRNGGYYVPSRLEQQMKEAKDRSAAKISEAITSDLLAFSAPTDDISIVVIKRRLAGGR
jgi:serine phosphatase RsbU (regulator of sigma subunit)